MSTPNPEDFKIQMSGTPQGIPLLNSVLTRPADTTAYVQYDLIANSTSAAVAMEVTEAVRAANEGLVWRGARLRSTNALAKGKTFRVHLFRSLPTLTVNDNGVFNASGAQTLAVSDIAGYVGYLDIILTEAGVAGAAGRANLDGERMIHPVAPSTSLWWVLEVRDAGGYTPLSAEQFHLVLGGFWS